MRRRCVSCCRSSSRPSPELGRGLQALLAFDGDVEATFAQSSGVQYDNFEELRAAELTPDSGELLRGVLMCVQDLKRAMPELGRGLQALLDFEGDVEATFAQAFEVQYDYFGELRTVELKPGGSGIPVTDDNRAEFVRRMTDYYLNRAVEEQFGAFTSGFLEVCT